MRVIQPGRLRVQGQKAMRTCLPSTLIMRRESGSTFIAYFRTIVFIKD